MILNAYAVLVAFVALLQFVVGVLLGGHAVLAWRQLGPAASAERKQAIEDRSYLLFLMAFVLLGLSLASWPLLYLLLQSYVPEWPGAMCIYGVTQIGRGSAGPARFLPGLIATLQTTKPAMVFLAGAWFVLYWLNRCTCNSALLRRVLVAQIAMALLAVVDAIVEGTYLFIPKKEEFLYTGCCAGAWDSLLRDSKFLPPVMPGDVSGSIVYLLYYAPNGLMALGLSAYLLFNGLHTSTKWLSGVFVGAVITLAADMLFVIQKVAPDVLKLPYHHCVYDLIARAPECSLAVALLVLGVFSVGWACVARWCGDCPETKPFLVQVTSTLVKTALVGYVGSVLMLSIEVLVA